MWGNWYDVRDYTPAEKEAKGCAKPDKPEPKVSTVERYHESCEAGGVDHWTVTTTISPVWDADNWQWVDGTPVVTESEKVFTAYTDEQYFDKCAPDAPKSELRKNVLHKDDCENHYTRGVVYRTDPVWDADSKSWVFNAEDEYLWRDTGWGITGPTQYTDEEYFEQCAPDEPEPKVSVEDGRSEGCEVGGVLTWTITTTINPVWDAVKREWVDGEPVVVNSEPVHTPYTDGEYFDLCALDQPEPKVTEASSTSYECGDDHQTVTKTVTTTAAVWNSDTRAWEDGKPEVQETVTQVDVPVVACPVKDEPKTPNTTPKNVLPNTGGPTVGWLIVGLVLVGVGIYFVRRRR